MRDSLSDLIGRQLAADEWDALRQAGSVARERHRSRFRYRLRFRVAGRQRVIPLGADPQRAEQVAEVLHKVQAPRQAARRLKRALISLRRAQTKAARQLQAELQITGYHWHGRMLRRTRGASVWHKLSE